MTLPDIIAILKRESSIIEPKIAKKRAHYAHPRSWHLERSRERGSAGRPISSADRDAPSGGAQSGHGVRGSGTGDRRPVFGSCPGVSIDRCKALPEHRPASWGGRYSPAGGSAPDGT